MRKIILLYTLPLMLLCSLISCQEDQIELFNGKPAIFIGVDMETAKPLEKDIDSVRTISFGFTNLQEVKINFVARLQGLAINSDRKVKIQLGGSATKGSDFELNENVILPAGAHYVLIPCRIIRNASLMDNQKEITLKIVGDDIFSVGDTTKAIVRISDGIPTEWYNNFFATYVFGTCTKAKYQFFFDFMGYYDLGDTGYQDLNEIANYLNRKIEDYNLNPAKYQNKYGAPPLNIRFEPNI